MPLDGFQQSTLQTLYGTSPPPSHIAEDPPDANAATFLRALSTAATQAAQANACGSLLAGHSSESDEFADVPIWLGPGALGAGHERDVLRALGLHGWLDRQINGLQMKADTGLPYIFRPADTSTPELVALRACLDEIEDKSFFAVEGDNGVVAYVLVGKLKGSDGWAGLLGVGISSDP